MSGLHAVSQGPCCEPQNPRYYDTSIYVDRGEILTSIIDKKKLSMAAAQKLDELYEIAHDPGATYKAMMEKLLEFQEYCKLFVTLENIEEKKAEEGR
jgi:hypothetical protein